MPGVCIFHIQKRKKWLLAFLPGLLFFFQTNIKAQSGVLQKNPAAEIFTSDRKAASPNEILGIGGCFVENIGQYGKVMKGYEALGPIQFGYEGLDMPVLFTSRGIIHLQRKIVQAEGESKRKEEKERKGKKEKEEWEEREAVDRTIALEWLNANTSVEIVAEAISPGLHTYGLLPQKARGFKKITYREMYPGIDVVYTFPDNSKPGFEYSIIVKPGADISVVRMKYAGDVQQLKKTTAGSLLITSDVNGITASAPVCYYSSESGQRISTEVIAVGFEADGNNEISFSFPDGYDSLKVLVIDPFVTSTINLSGINAGKAKDVDFDYDGNVYVTGGGSFTTTHSLAKYNANGVLQWTFNGTLAIPSWTYGTYYGGWMVEKPTGNIYLGQGFQPGTGFRVMRINTNGLYDNYITTANANFMEAWKMFWSCNNGSPQILIAGGGLNSNINFGAFTPPATTVTSLNITNIPYAGGTGWAQDIADFVFDPANNDMYSIFGSTFGTPSINNRIYKNTAPYSAASVAWNIPTGYTTIQEAANRPYLTVGGLNDNSANMLWVNASYLFYWDGKHLKAFNKTTGAGVGTPLVTANTAFMQGGIIADACNNVFVGDGNGVIKVYHFNGTSFSDAPADITIPGYAGKAVYDLAYDEAKKLVYASGDGFVASFDVSAYCPATLYTVNVVTDCITKTATATVSPIPPPGSVITYTLYTGSTPIATNTTGVFSGLTANITYAIIAVINRACSGSQATANFLIAGPAISTNLLHTVCGAATGAITITGTGSTGPYTYSIDGINFLPSGIFTGLSAGIYTVTVKDANGCPNSVAVIIQNTNGPLLTYTQTNADCGNNTGTVTATATGGTSPYQYSINGGSTYQTNNFFTGLVAGAYTLIVKDANNCTNTAEITITTSQAPSLTATPAAATCNQSNGTITAFGSSGTAPYQYSIDGNTFQNNNLFTGLPAGVYTLFIRDANGCTKTVSVTIANNPAPTLTATSTPAGCGNINGTITSTGTGGIAPYQYSIDGGVSFQASNVFTGLAPGIYTITIKDNTGCINIVTVTVASSNAPVVTAVATASSCTTSSGTITVTATGGTPAYQYSINGINFFAGNSFINVAGGNYIVYVRDATGCIGTYSLIVPSLSGPSLTASVTPSACGSNTGIITANGIGGTAPLQYSLDGVNYFLTNIFSNLAPGSYTVYIKDANNCIKTVTVTVTNVSNLSLSVSTLTSACSGSSGTITAIAAGGAGALQYSINGVTYQGSNVFTGLTPGVYSVYVRDANGCIVTRQVTVATVSPPSLTISLLHQATCGSASGVVRANGSGGVTPLTYSLDGGAYQSANIFINLAVGVHSITVKDANGCISASQTVTIVNTIAGTPPTDVTFRVNNILACTGEGRIKNIRGLPSGGGNGYIFSLDGGAFTTANQFRPVAAGVHVVTAMNDQSGCIVSRLATIGIGTAATAVATATPSICGGSTGTVTVTGVGGSTPYHTSINNGTSWQTFFPPGGNTFTYTGLAPGTYTITIADDADFVAGPPDIPGACLSTIFVTVPSTGGPSISITQTNATCNTGTGSITATGNGGILPYSYNINGGAFTTNGLFNNLVPGVYAVNVMDGTGCTTGANVTILGSSVPLVTTTVLSASCAINNGTITANGTGGTAPLEYSLNGTVFQAANIFTGLAPGTYTVYVKDINNCYSTTTAVISNTSIVRVTAFTVAASCGMADGMIVATGTNGTPPYQFSLDGTVFQSSNTFSALAAGFYTITIKDARGCLNTTGISVTNNGASTINSLATPSTCNNANGTITITATGGIAPLAYSKDGINFQSSNVFTGLLSGNFLITVRDANGCLTIKQVFVGNINGPQILTASIIHAACGLNNGRITATASGGTGVLQYSIDGTNYFASNVFSGLAAGSYNLYVKDANGCVKTIPVMVNNLPGPVATATASPSSCGQSDGSITVLALGGTLNLSYSINGGTTFQSSNIFTGLAAGNYTVLVKDFRNCTSTSIPITVISSGSVMPVFTQVLPICAGSVLAALPVTSTNGITGTWSPTVNNTATTIYTFTPSAGQCATAVNMTIVVNPRPSAILIYHN